MFLIVSRTGQRQIPDATAETVQDLSRFLNGSSMPGLLIAWRPPETDGDTMAAVGDALSVGRAPTCGWSIADALLSRAHFQVERSATGFVVRDLGSRNGVRVGGTQIDEPVAISDGAVIRAGSHVFVFIADILSLTSRVTSDSDLMAGEFHSPPIVRRLHVAARTGRHVLLEGESGAGKELAATLLHRLLGKLDRTGRLLAHNSACFAGEDDAVGTIFGVVRGAFTGVSERTGAIALANGGTLFLDEVHNLPLRVQRSLLRFIDDQSSMPLGGQVDNGTRFDVRLVLGTNLPVEASCEQGQLAPDLVSRLHRVKIPPLRERRADIPTIFLHVLRTSLDPETFDEVSCKLDAAIAERLCLHDYRLGNVRELQDLASVIGARIAVGEPPSTALSEAIDEALGAVSATGVQPLDPGNGDLYESLYTQHRDEIIAAYHEAHGVVAHLERLLGERGIRCTRRWLTVYLDRWGVRPIRRRK